MSPELKKFVQDNKDLINENTKDSWEEVYKELPEKITGEFTTIMLSAGIDPAQILGYIPRHYLYNSNIANYKIPDGVTSIGEGAFYACESWKNITIPNSVTRISDYAFMYCIRLTSIKIPGSVTNIGDGAFHACERLENVVIGEGVTSISSGAFACCDRLTSVVMPSSVTYIGRKVFCKDNELNEIIFKGTRKQAIQLGIGRVSKEEWREGSPIRAIICNDGAIRYWG